MTRLSWTLGPSIFPGHILDQTAKPCAVKIALNPPKNHLSGEDAKLCFCCWSQLWQGKYLYNINSCGESKTPAYFSSLLLIVLLIIQCVLKAEPSAVGQRQNFYCWPWPGTAKLWCSAELPHAAAWGMCMDQQRMLASGRARRKRLSRCKELYGAAAPEEAAGKRWAAGGDISCPPSRGHGWALQSCCSPQLAGDKHLLPGEHWERTERLGDGRVI